MTTTIGASTPYVLTIPELTETADIQVALKLLSYGTSSDPANDAAITAGSLVGYLKTKSNIASPTFTGTVYAPTIKAASSANDPLALSTINQSSGAGSITITAGNSTTSGNGGSITLTAGSSASSNPGNIVINAGGGTATGTISLGTAFGSNQPITLGTSASTVTVAGALTVGGGFGSTGVTISSAGNIDSDGALTVGGGYGSSGVTISSTGAISLDATLTAGSNIVTDGKTNSVTEQVSGFFFGSSGQVQATRSTGTPLYSHRHGAITGSQDMIQFVYKGVLSGTVATTSGGTPAFTAASDYRIKTDITPITNAIERMKNAKAYTFYKNIDPTHTLQTGFIAHELAEVQSDLVVGEKDAVDKDGNPIYQEVMETKLIPVMAQAINDLIGLVEKLTSRIEELETK
jgi:hypothetical protein